MSEQRPTRVTRPKRRRLPKPERVCYFCKGPIPDDEKAIQAKTENAWAHFECWYSGDAFERNPKTGRLVKP